LSATNRGERGGEGQDFFATPRPAVDAMVPHLLKALDRRSLAGVTILDPSGGRGNLIKAALAHGADPELCWAVEINEKRATVCAELLPPGHVICGDWLRPTVGDRMKLSEIGFDLILTNPPFDGGEAHLRRDFLVVRPGGLVCALNRTAFYLESEERAPFRAEHPCDLFPMSWRLSFTREILSWATEEDLLAMRRPKKGAGAQLTITGPELETLAEVKKRLAGSDNAPHAWALFGEGRGGRYQVLENPRGTQEAA